VWSDGALIYDRAAARARPDTRWSDFELGQGAGADPPPLLDGAPARPAPAPLLAPPGGAP
jgi:hypothetical protein